MTAFPLADLPWDINGHDWPEWFYLPEPAPPKDLHSQVDPALLGPPPLTATTDEFIASSRSLRLHVLAFCARLRHHRGEPPWPATGC
jgi:hypothetical protein